MEENTALKITYVAEMSFLLSKPWVTKFLQISRTLPGCLSQFRCFSWSAQLQLPKQNNLNRNLNRALLKNEINFVTELKEVRARLNVSQIELAGLLGYSTHRILCDFETLQMTPANWRKWQEKIKPWLENPTLPSQDNRKKGFQVKALHTLKKHRAYLEAVFEKDPQPSSLEIADIAEKIGLEAKVVRQWFETQRMTKTFVSTKMEDPTYKKNLKKSVREAISTVEEFKKTQKDLGHSTSDVALSPYWPHKFTALRDLERLKVTENQLEKYHQNLKDWMTNPPALKESRRNKILMEEHREYLNQVFNSEAHPSQEKIKQLADHTGIRVKSLQQWFINRRSQKSKMVNKYNMRGQSQKDNTKKLK